MKRTRTLPTLMAIRARRAWRSLTAWVIQSEVDEGWLLLLFAAVIGSAGGAAVILVYGLIDRIRQVAGWADANSGSAGLPWIALLTVPLGLSLAHLILKGAREDRSGEMVPTLDSQFFVFDRMIAFDGAC